MAKSYSAFRAQREQQTTTCKAEVERFLAHIEANKHINAFLTVTAQEALAAAVESDKRFSEGTARALEGMVIAIKDNISTKGIRTTCASKMLENFVPVYSATVIERLQSQGAIIIGKTNLDEFAMGSSNETSAFGPVLNPINTDYVPGGSSGGSAAAVAGAFCHVSLGSDTGGSVRLPAAFCGVLGYKPTYGRISRYGLVAFASSLDQIGIFAHCAEDVARTLDWLSGVDTHDATTMSEPPTASLAHLANPLSSAFTFAVPTEEEISACSPEVIGAIKKAKTILEAMGGTAIETTLEHNKIYLPTYYIIATAEASSNLARFDGVRYGFRSQTAEGEDMTTATRTQGFGPEVQRRIMLGTFVLSSGYYDAYYSKALRARQAISEFYHNLFNKADIFLLPTSADIAFKFGEKSQDPIAMYLTDLYTVTANIAGIPAISIPAGTGNNAMPIAVQVQAGYGNDELLLRVTHRLEQELKG